MKLCCVVIAVINGYMLDSKHVGKFRLVLNYTDKQAVFVQLYTRTHTPF